MMYFSGFFFTLVTFLIFHNIILFTLAKLSRFIERAKKTHHFTKKHAKTKFFCKMMCANGVYQKLM